MQQHKPPANHPLAGGLRARARAVLWVFLLDKPTPGTQQRMHRTAVARRAATARAAFRSGQGPDAQRRLQSTAVAAAAADAAHGGGYSQDYLPPPHVERNPGQPLDLQWATSRKTNAAAIEARAGEIGARRSIKKEAQAAWLLRALTCIDLTTLAGDDTPGNVKRMCAKARNPVRRDILEKLGVGHLPITTGAVCVYPARVADAAAALAGSSLGVAAVATGFPSGQIKLEHKLAEIRGAVADGATEIDIVIPRDKALTGDWAGVYEEVSLFREACGEAHLKTILATGELATYKNIATASMVCMMAGADFIKTSTGKEPTNATLGVSLVMARCIRDYHDATGYKIGFKPAGGISAAKQALVYQALMKDELGIQFCIPNHDFCIQNDEFRKVTNGCIRISSGRHFVLKMMKFLFKMMNFVFKMMTFVSSGSVRAACCWISSANFTTTRRANTQQNTTCRWADEQQTQRLLSTQPPPLLPLTFPSH